MNPIPIQSAQRARSDLPRVPGAEKVLPEGDTRWVLAARACLAADGPSQMEHDARERLKAWGVRRGISPIHAAAIIAMGEMAAASGGLSRADAERLATFPVPTPSPVPESVGRFLAISIVVLTVAAGVLFVVRWM
ncbi:MAG: hypothetical protein LAT64_04095 [Phycisphaerales bacterium]|nr:hypothetical protein [Planctomycetota bacterium]MCH8507934.1 hypothetical protein [Phycisphaerales bacterium]